MKHVLFALCLFSGVQCLAQQPLYKDSTQPVERRVADLLSRMTPEEKSWQIFMIPGDMDHAEPGQYRNGLFGFQVSAGGRGDAGGQMLNYNTSENALRVAHKINGIQKYFVEQTRLGIPIIAFDEALHGLVRAGATAFPQSIGLAATWDTTLMRRVAGSIARETGRRGIRDILSPVVNLASDVRWGRTEETYGEDPFLASAMGVAFVSAFERRGIITTPKHFVANVGDGGRDSYPIHYNERLLDELYLAPFKACIEKGGSRSIMSAYNSVDGTAASSNGWLLLDKLKKQWGFKGFVISDANAVGGELVLHHTAGDYPSSAQHAINGGLDVIFQTEYKHHALFLPDSALDGIDSARLNDAVARVLRAKFELGLFEHPYISETMDAGEDKENKAIARQAARESFVLLKNEGQVLPIRSGVKTIAVLGADAAEARLGGYSGPGNGKVSILEGIKERVRVIYAEGANRHSQEYSVIPGGVLGFKDQAGLHAAYFATRDMNGTPVTERTDKGINFHWTLSPPAPGLSTDFYSVRWTGSLTAPVTGKYRIGLEGNDGYRLYINDSLIVSRWEKQSYHATLADYTFVKGRKYSIRVEFFETNGDATIRLVWNVGDTVDRSKKISEAVAAARQADMAVVVAGITEGEFQDRAMLSLPGDQETLIQAVAATGKPLVVLLVGGSAITMSNWIDKAPAIGAVWYPGEEGGHAVADVLFGDYNPAGRLPITYPVHEAQLPLVYNHKPTGRGDDYNNLSGMPLFPFGFGLSYTQFAYSDLSFDRATIAAGDSTRVSFVVKNVGDKEGDEVVQLYIHDELASVARPVMELKGFQRVHLRVGESRKLYFSITPEMLQMLDKDLHRVIEPGAFRIMVGGSSRDLRLKGDLTVRAN
ncbi:MAG TPA: glycoside hydrolase family 3 C-terminal domain-containing protein [Puia sp.]|nr:glycoside hydrolase family 3 C-terminal domain-containing protein [Puia sp.]